MAAAELELGDWTLERAGIEQLEAEVAAGRRTVVECGSGASTVALARALEGIGEGGVHALEHDPTWAARTRARIAAEGLEARATVVEARLAFDPIAAGDGAWYERRALDRLPAAGIDLLLVDGPPASPGTDRERSRYPALARLRDRLAPGATVIVDDAGRAGEEWAIARWESEFGLRFERRGGRIAIARLGR